MKKLYSFLLLLFVSHFVVSQTLFFEKSDSFNLKRTICVSSGIGLTWSASTIGFSNIWYSEYSHAKFHTFNDSKNWLQMDKVGHFYTANKLSILTSDLFKWSGLTKNKSILLGSCIGLGLQTTLELMDGISSEWGFSWSDMTFNTGGVFSYSIQDLIWSEQKILFKFSYSPTQYASIRPTILGSTFSESFFKDYNGQTYWMSFSPSSFFRSIKIPNWICLSLGYSVDQKLVGDKEVYMDLKTNITYYSKREYLFSFDIDFSKIPIKRKWLSSLVKQFNYIKIPFPALIFSQNKFSVSGLYF